MAVGESAKFPFTDYYRVLGVDATASGRDIAAAFRRLAKQLHPDVSDEPGASEEFERVVAAYHVLGNARDRYTYDMMRAMRLAPTVVPPPATLRATRFARLRHGVHENRWWLISGIAVVMAIFTVPLLHSATRGAGWERADATRVEEGSKRYVSFVTRDGEAVQARDPGGGSDFQEAIYYNPDDPQEVARGGVPSSHWGEIFLILGLGWAAIALVVFEAWGKGSLREVGKQAARPFRWFLRA
jgi:curved DNA-binding protein CbpA